MSRTPRLLAVAFAFVALLVPAAAHASPLQTSIMMDDDLLVNRDDSTATKALEQMKKLGVDTVRVTVLWKTVAQNTRFSKSDLKKLKGKYRTAALKQNKRFKPTNPSTYPIRNWDRYDNLVNEAANVGIKIYFNVTGPGPAWAMTKPPKAQHALAATWKPRPSAFKQFVTAVGTRFSGTYHDEDGNKGVIPRVRFWSLWNEPNQAGWLSPQWEKHGSQMVPASPALYRELYQYGYKGLVASGHRVDTDIILMGETAPNGTDAKTTKSPMRPGLFLRELACVDPAGNPYAGSAATLRKCSDFAKRGPLIANGYAHHPYTKNVPPTVADPNPDTLTMANIGSLGTLLDTLSAKTGGDIPANLPLFMTEFGFETNPPDPFSGVAPALQAAYDDIGEYQAWQNPRIQSQAQFLLRDVAPVRTHKKNSKAYWFTYQSGLFYLNGTAKPALAAYATPFLAFDAHTTDPTTGTEVFNLWGQMRLLPNGTQTNVQIQWRDKTNPSAPWISVGDPVPIDGMGYFQATRSAPAAVTGEWRSALIVNDPTTGVPTVIASSPGTGGI
ncbi:MAG TPA: hypothetical protein VHZ31_10125 [Solirubrobacteraceae bacterium]|jgi:hypothetical protein|nr:hypothetical protein [Solirubrobacteraceae bacterium]